MKLLFTCYFMYYLLPGLLLTTDVVHSFSNTNGIRTRKTTTTTTTRPNNLNKNVSSNISMVPKQSSSFDPEVAIPRQKELIAKGSPKQSDAIIGNHVFEQMASWISQTAAEKTNASTNDDNKQRHVQLVTLLRVGIPSLISAILGTYLFPFLALTLATIMNDAGVFAVLSQDSSQFVQNFLTVAGLLFSILVGQTYYFMYQQQEAVYYALFNEVTEAKSLLEQVALVCQGRSMYRQVLKYISNYVEYDLKQLQCDPAVLLSARPVDDPLESIMYMTSVGVPSTVYETVRSLRQARAARLGALQRKLPKVHMILLWVLAAIELCSFPLLGAGTQTIGGYNILTVEGCLFGVMTFGVVLTLRVVGELWRPVGGAYNVDAVLATMVRGLEEELQLRMSISSNSNSNSSFKNEILASPGPDIPSRSRKTKTSMDEQLRQQGAGAGLGRVLQSTKKFLGNRRIAIASARSRCSRTDTARRKKTI